MPQNLPQSLDARALEEEMPAARGERAANEYASANVDRVLQQLGVTRDGLTESEAQARLLRFGLNVLPRPKQRSWYLQLLATFVHLFAVLLWVAAALA